MQDETWKRRAKCLKVNPLFFFPSTGTGRSLEESERPAKAFCKGALDGKECPVRTQCLLYAIDKKIHEGVFGGIGEAERAELRRNKEAVAFLRKRLNKQIA